MNQIIAMHGWCYDSSTWIKWEKHFKERGWLWQSMERGYGNRHPVQPKWINKKEASENFQQVVISHSLGSHLIGNKILEEATAVALISSFSQFIPKGSQSRALKAGLKGMQRCLGTSEEQKMLTNFDKKVKRPALKNSISLMIDKKNIVIGKTQLDITNDILELLNKKISNISLN